MSKFTAANYVVAIHDIMGQSSLLQKWNKLESLTTSQNEAIDAFEKTTNRIWDVRHDFRNLIDTFAGTGINFTGLELPDHVLNELKEIDRFEIRHQSFSDTNIWFTEAHTVNRFIRAKRVLYLLYGIAG